MKRSKTVPGLCLYASMFDDIVACDRAAQTSLSRDLLYLEKMIINRGLPFIMIDMPEAGKVVDSALSRGWLDPSKLPQTFGAVDGGSRKFLSGLFSRVFDHLGQLRDEVSSSAIYQLRQVLYLAKKVRKECSYDAILAEVDAFQHIDRSLRDPSLNWDGDALEFPERPVSMFDSLRASDDMVGIKDHIPRPLLEIVERVADHLMARWAKQFDYRELRPRHGPGTVADAGRKADKFLFPTWSPKLECGFPHSYFAWSSEYEAFCASFSPVAASDDVRLGAPSEPPVRLKHVPKTLKSPRMIASEPTSHQFLQLGLMRWMRENLPSPLHHCLDFRNQVLSQEACLAASRTGTSATVDLSAASDRLSCWTVERVFRRAPALLQALFHSRSRWLVNDVKLDNKQVGERYYLRLRKYAPMGNGTTFPVQSIVYAIFSIAAVLYENGTLARNLTNGRIRQAAREVRVFGDDIVLPSRATTSLFLILDYFQLKVNHMKTHVVGHFRESCGMDAFRGEDVTPLYLADLELGDKPHHLVSWLDVMKNAKSRNLHWLCSRMEEEIPAEWLNFLPHSDADLGCLTLPSIFTGTTFLAPKNKVRWNPGLQRQEVLGLVLTTKQKKSKRETDSNLVQYWTDSPEPDSPWESGFVVENRILLRKRWVPMS